MSPHSPAGARRVRLGRVLALAFALLFGLWLAQAALIAVSAAPGGASAQLMRQMAPGADEPGRAVRGANAQMTRVRHESSLRTQGLTLSR